MSVSSIVKTNVSGTITLIDGTTPTAIELALSFDRGDLNVSGLKEVLNETITVERRGRFVNSAHGNRVYPSFSFSCWLSAFQDSGTAPGNILTWIQRTTGSAYAALVSSLQPGASANADTPFAFDIKYDLEGADFGDSADHTFTLGDCEVLDFTFAEAADGLSVSVNGVVRGAVSGDLEMAQVA